MVRISKSSAAPAAHVVATPEPTAPPETPVVKKTRKTKPAAAAAPEPEVVTAAPVPEPTTSLPEVEETAAAAAALEVPTPSHLLSAKLTEFSQKLQQLVSLAISLKVDKKNLDKAFEKHQKLTQRRISKKKKATSNRQPSGFVKPTRITNETAVFFNIPGDTLIARTEVHKLINQYIHDNNLKDPDNGRKINPDEKLQKLLKLTSNDELSYFNLQTHMKHLFIKDEKPATAAVVH
jgi:chromatin remodeling complex protein RSC6